MAATWPRRERAGVLIGMAIALAVTVAAFDWAGSARAPSPSAAPVLLWAATSSLTSLWLFLAVARLAAHRFLSPQDIAGAGLTTATPRARVLAALVQNTLEQTVLAVVTYGVWLALAGPARGLLVVACAVLFGAGRLLFFLGYEHGAAARAVGFGLTFYPTVGLIALALPRATSLLLAL
jgi:hypothetical protein